MTRQLFPRRSALATVLVALVATLGLVRPAAAVDSVATSSPHHSVELSTLAARPGDAVTITVTISNPTNAPVNSSQNLYSSAGFLEDQGTCTTLQGGDPEACDTYRDGGAQYYALYYGYGGASTEIPAHSSVKTSLTTTVSADAAPGAYSVIPYGAFNGADDTYTPGSFTFTVLDEASEADLAVGLGARATLLNSSIVYTQTATNHGPATVASGTVTTKLPSQTFLVTGLPSNCSYQAGTKTVTCAYTNLANASTATTTFTARQNVLALGPLPATATRTASSPTDPVPANNQATATCTVVTGLIILC
ncbi:hypothetical protein ABT160_22945 [Streptomyces sp. NPDC001941]|uniref:hypothetical protein n=1 Tax=Streptomyces sp. NPDC001941 TaxID=3154659 RepID=UPI003322395B